MTQGEKGDLVLEVALTRYRQGQCPGCGKGLGDPKGLEQRRRRGDLYRHTCKRTWPLQMEAVVLWEELTPQQSTESGSTAPKCREDPPRRAADAGSRTYKLFKKFFRRR